MPLGWERINAKRTQPNSNIVFIKPLSGEDQSKSQEFLERIAAQCTPIMNKHHLAVASLEEYPPNLEFWGRNFNNGEVIQLVLKSPSTGRWLPFKFVQMVMMHELAHCKQMNHSGAFWKVRNEYSTEMKGLWERGYTGDGLWGQGVLLKDGAFMGDQLGEGEVLPEHLCGGTFKSRGGGKKRKAKPKITYKEQKERRIRKKFGVDGVALGEDVATKVALEKGKTNLSKPKVAGSKRGRELRAAAALARFEVKKEEPDGKDEDLVTDSEAESDVEDEMCIKPEPDDALDLDGSRLVDRKGRGMVKVCEDEDRDNEDAKREFEELRGMESIERYFKPDSSSKVKRESQEEATSNGPGSSSTKKPTRSKNIETNTATAKTPSIKTRSPIAIASETKSHTPPLNSAPPRAKSPPPSPSTCPICSLENPPHSLTCTICANVLRPKDVHDSWKCTSAVCRNGPYINAGDVAFCGACGERKGKGI
ncbi:putative wlm domain-containing protein [Botrytis fragariae]|uniref:Putative wlm domain-containing protein n=1 Tax=Botrytis fragariae TaxID=1964551 RepID=A0A8H6AXU4_9HELO|nr:putative wlm domain-containing protein [Botrytis fragariae]KAF5875435.1 putative wlm domain-containing protein [Botrytis fragariae]